MVAKSRQNDPLIRLGIVTYVFALALIAAFTLAFHFLADSIVRHQEMTASVVNLSGRQRMLSQRIARLALERASHANYRPDAKVQEGLLLSISQMDSAHQVLLHGSDALHMPGPASQQVADVYLHGPWMLDAQLQDFLQHARAVAGRPAAEISFADPDVTALQLAAQAPLLDALNAAVTANQETSERSIRHLRGTLTGLTIGMLAILVAEALFLYRPLFRRLARAHHDLVQAGRTDPLTGCLNRRAFTQEAQQAIAVARQRDEPLAVLMLDIDRFKSINDRYGHPVGDRVINSVVHTLIATIRDKDVLCRMGGEEFAVLIPGDWLAESTALAERIRQTVARTPVPLSDGGAHAIHLTISIGVAMLDPADLSIFEVLGRADQALYLAKSGGRNQVVNRISEEVSLLLDEAVHSRI